MDDIMLYFLVFIGTLGINALFGLCYSMMAFSNVIKSRKGEFKE